MDSATLAGVEEVTAVRAFRVSSANNADVYVTFTAANDSLYCGFCHRQNYCEHASRLRLSGLITHSVKNVRTRKKETNAATAAKE